MALMDSKLIVSLDQFHQEHISVGKGASLSDPAAFGPDLIDPPLLSPVEGDFSYIEAPRPFRHENSEVGCFTPKASMETTP